MRLIYYSQSSLIILILLFISCQTDVNETNFQVTIDSVFKETRFFAPQETCSASITLYETELNREVMKYRNECNFDPDRDIPVLKSLLAAIRHKNRIDSLRTLAWGRLTPNLGEHSLLSIRLAGAASESAYWDKRSGKPVGGSENKIVRDLLNEQNIFSEVRSLFHEQNLRIDVKSVEKVLIYQAKEIYDYNQLQKIGINPTDLLPVDCQIWFRLDSAQESGS